SYQTLEGHDDVVTCLLEKLNGKLIISASKDMTIKLWEHRSGTCLRTLVSAHTDCVNFLSDCPALYPSYVISCSIDQSIKVWDIFSGKLMKTILGHTESVEYLTSVNYQNKIL